MKNFSDTSFREARNTLVMFFFFFFYSPEIPAVYEKVEK